MAEASSSVGPGCWVRIHRSELAPAERSDAVPDDTASVPLETWINGWLIDRARLGDQVTIRTATGRRVEGQLIEADPSYTHSFGPLPPALQHVGERARSLVFERRVP